MTGPAARLRPAVLDLVVAVGLVVAVVVETTVAAGPDQPWTRTVLGAVAVASVAVRRSLPTVAAAVLAGAMTVQSLATEPPDETAVLFACVLVSWSVGMHAARREGVLGVVLAALGVSVAIATDASDTVANIVPTVTLFVLLPYAVGTVVRRRQQDVAALTLETAALAREAEAAVEQERRRIARELHDVVSHAVTLIAVQAEAGQAVLDDDPAAARRSLAAIGRVSREALEELHRLLAVLRDHGPAEEEPGLDRLGSLVEGTRAAGLEVAVTAPEAARELDREVDRCAYRVVQEALTNALRHTSDARVEVTVGHSGGRLQVRVRSEGRRHASAYGGTGRGLAGLRERVNALGGTFSAEPVGDRGYDVRADLPVRA